MNRFRRAGLSLAAIAAIAAAGQLPAVAAQDTTPPVLHAPRKAHFIVGTQLDQWSSDGYYFYNVPQLIRWTGSDDSGQLYYTVWEHPLGDEPYKLADFIEETSFQVLTSDYDSQFGGGSFATGNWSVAAHDYSGNSVERAVYGAHLTVTQDDGTQTREHETADVSIDYVGAWQTSLCGCFAAGSTHKTVNPNAAANIHVSVPSDEGVRKIALVMEKAPGRGKAQVYVDGALAKTIDTYAAAPTHKVVVWQGSLSVGDHLVKVVNLATPGRSRIDVDAVVIN